jgi:hypothetical protein
MSEIRCDSATAFRMSEGITLIVPVVPVVPVSDGESCRFIAVHRDDLSQERHHVTLAPPNSDEDINPTQIFMSESGDRDVFTWAQR